MSRSKQIIALAEWAGWTKCGVARTDPLLVVGYDERARQYNLGMQTVPSESLDWIAALEARLDKPQRRIYADVLCGMFYDGSPNPNIEQVISAKAPSRIEALCRALWPERFK
jgi:hypothetical protein